MDVDKVRAGTNTATTVTEPIAQKTPARWVRITSDDGFTFIVQRKVALAGPTLAASLNEDSE